MSEYRVDSLLPPEMARKAEAVGEAKATMAWRPLFALAVLAGAFIALGAVFATTVVTGGTAFGPTRLMGGVVFSLGLILVVVGGAELFTGNNLIVMAWASRRVKAAALLRNWGIVYTGNFVGAVGTALLVLLAGHHKQAWGQVGDTALQIAEVKMSMTFMEAFARGVLCNALVCLAVWLSFSARTTVGKVAVVVPPIAAFVACGFEHCVANMYFVPVAQGITYVEEGAVAEAIGWGPFLTKNLVPVTLGNIVGGALLVGAVYTLVYRPSKEG